MATKSILRSAGIKSPGARALMTPMSSKSILKRPAPLPLSPSSALPITASFSIALSPSASKLSPHVHFPAPPAMVATFSAFSPGTYNRAPMPLTPSSADFSHWSGRVISPSGPAFKLANPPKRASVKSDTLAVPSPFEDPRSPKPYKVSHHASKEQALTAPDKDFLAPPPPFQDPRSPKPFRERLGARFEQLVLHVPRPPAEDLGKALTSFPRSPYPSAPLASEEDADMSDLVSPGRGRPSKMEKPTHTRTRSLDIKSKRPQQPGILGSATNGTNLLSPVTEAPGGMRSASTASKPAPLDLESEASLSNAFWQVMIVEEAPLSSARDGLTSPGPSIMFGNQDGTLWSPRPRKREYRGLGDMASMLTPAQRNVFRRDVVASPSPNDPFAAFPSFTAALVGMDGTISYPPRAHVEH